MKDDNVEARRAAALDRLIVGAHRRGDWYEAGIRPAEVKNGLLGIRYHGRYAWMPTDQAHPRQRALAASSLLPHQDDAALGGWAAAFLLGVTEIDGTTLAGDELKPLLCLPFARQVRRNGVGVLRSALDCCDAVTLSHEAVRLTSPLRTAFDLARTADSVVHAVENLDAMARYGISPAEVAEYAEVRRRWKGAPLVRRAAHLASPRTRSVAESRWRLLWVLDAGLPTPMVNATVFDARGTCLGEVDVLDPVLGLVGEYDGAPHSSAQARARDAVKQEGLERAGLVVVRGTGVDLSRFRRRTVHRLRQAAERARRRPNAGWQAVELPMPELALRPVVGCAQIGRHAGRVD